MRAPLRLLLLLPLAVAGCSADESYSSGPPSQGGTRVATGDRYTAVGTNPFVEAAHDPFSTFAIDVDTASYDIFRRDLERGQLPDPDSVRLEEYVNSFTYAYDAPAHDSAVPFAIDVGAAPAVTNARTSIVRIGLQARAPAPSERRVANLVFLIDTSCSMQGEDRLGLVKTVLNSAVDALVEEDMVSIVTYAGSTLVALPATPITRKTEILSAIDGFTAGGGTGGAAGIDLAYTQAESAFIPGGFNHVILCTDGDFNLGPSSDEALLELIRSKRDSGVTLTVLGFGAGNLNDSMIEKITNAGNGFYSVISTAPQARRYGASGLFQAVEIVARDVKVQVEMNPAHVEAYRLLGYENRLLADDEFDDDHVDGGEIGAGHSVTALYEIVRVGHEVPSPVRAPATIGGAPVPGQRTISPGDALTVRVRFEGALAGDADAASEIGFSLTPEALDGAESDPDTEFAAALAAFAEILKHSPFADPARLDAIEATLSAQAGRDPDRAELAALVQRARALLTP